MGRRHHRRLYLPPRNQAHYIQSDGYCIAAPALLPTLVFFCWFDRWRVVPAQAGGRVRHDQSCVLPVGPGSDWWFGLTWLFLLIDRAPTLLLPVHPHLVSRADDLATVDVDALAVVDVVADLHVGLADYALAHAGLVSGDVVHETFVMQVQGFALQEERIGVLTA